jgi:hypothetical protein
MEYMHFNLDNSGQEFEVWSEKRIIYALMLMLNRCLFLSDSGTFGVALEFALKGDILSIAFGCLTPLVLRSCKSYYTIVGNACVHGIMHSETIKLLEKGELKVEQFEVH